MGEVEVVRKSVKSVEVGERETESAEGFEKGGGRMD